VGLWVRTRLLLLKAAEWGWGGLSLFVVQSIYASGYGLHVELELTAGVRCHSIRLHERQSRWLCEYADNISCARLTADASFEQWHGSSASWPRGISSFGCCPLH